MVKGRVTYVPKEFIEELDNTCKIYELKNRSEAMRKIIQDMRIGREIKFKLRR